MALRRGNREGSKPQQRKDGRWAASVAWTDAQGLARRTTVYGKTATECRTKLKTVIKRLDGGLPGTDAKTGVAGYVEHWVTTTLPASDRKASTKAGYTTLARKHIGQSSLGVMTLDKVKPSHVEGWLVEMREKGLSESTRRQVFTILRAILDTAVRDGLLGTNPAAAIKRPTVAHKEAEYLTPEQVRALLSHAKETRYEPMFRLLVNTGLRRGEALALTWADVDLDERLLRVRGTLARVDGKLVVTTTKTPKSRRAVPLTDAAVEVLREVKQRQRKERLRAGSKWQRTPYVFTTELGDAADPRNALRALKAAAKKAKLGNVGLHTLRHSAATMMLVNGVPLKVVSEIMGHSSITVTADTYGHVAPDVSRDAMDRLGAALDG